MKQVASLRYGVIFKKAFSQPDIFKAFVKAVLNVDLEIDNVETEKSFEPLMVMGNVDSRFDLFAEDVKNRIIVDIQHARYADHYDRFLHYHCAAILEQIANSHNYRPNLHVFTIVILTSGDKHKTDVAVIDFDPKDLNGNGLNEIRHKVIYLCPKYVNDNTPAAYKEWLEAIQDTLDEEVDESHYQNVMIQKIFSAIEKNSITPSERAEMFEEYNRRELLNKEIKDSKIETAKKLLAAGVEVDIVLNTMNLTLDDLQESI